MNEGLNFPIIIIGKQDGTVARALVFYQCGPGSNPGADTMYLIQ